METLVAIAEWKAYVLFFAFVRMQLGVVDYMFMARIVSLLLDMSCVFFHDSIIFLLFNSYSSVITYYFLSLWLSFFYRPFSPTHFRFVCFYSSLPFFLSFPSHSTRFSFSISLLLRIFACLSVICLSTCPFPGSLYVWHYS